jgi:ubiquinone/menaquinone biosynthesis C-methylase UbiE
MNEEKHVELNKAKWDRWSESADGKGLVYEYLRRGQRRLLSMADLKENMTFLDLGCGTGQAIGLAAKSVNYKGSFYGVDLSSGMVEKAKENFRDLENFHFIIANSESIPLQDNFFDIIICSNSFHHYLHPEKAMSEISRLLKTGGKLYILDPTADSWIIKIIDKIIKIFEPAHVRIYSTREFEKLISGSRLKYSGSQKIQGHESVHEAIK